MVSYFCYTFIIQSAGERIFKTGQHLAVEVTGKMVDRLFHPIRLTLLSSKDAELAR